MNKIICFLLASTLMVSPLISGANKDIVEPYSFTRTIRI